MRPRFACGGCRSSTGPRRLLHYRHAPWLLRVALTICTSGAVQAADDPRPLEPGFEVTTWAGGLVEPIALEFAPDGQLLVAERGGTVRVVIDGQAGPPIFQIPAYVENENGLLGMALDPAFAVTRRVYLFVTISRSEQRIIRFVARPGAATTDYEIVRDRLPTSGVFHSGGGLKFAPDGKLYFSIGDTLDPQTAQDMNSLAGKICRIDPDGAAPADNPFTTPTGLPRSIYALGFRNVFRFCFAPDGRLFAMDVGSDGDGRREEINLVRAGANYGWPLVEGRQGEPADPRFVDPIYDYHDGGAAPCGAVYYTGSQFPGSYRGNLFHLEYVLGRVYRVVLDGDRVVAHTTFVQGYNGPVDITQGPDGCLYYCELHSGLIRRIRYVWSDPPSVPDEPVPPPGTLCGPGVLPAMLMALLGAGGRMRTRRTPAAYSQTLAT